MAIKITKTKKNQVLDFLKYHPEFTLRLFSIYYPISISQIIKYGDKLKWDSQDSTIHIGDRDDIPFVYPEIRSICDNKNIAWSIELLEKFNKKVVWKNLSRNPSLNWWSSDLIRYFKDKWDWKELSSNFNLHLNEDQIDEFKDYWNWESQNFHLNFSFIDSQKPIFTGICMNKSIDWDKSILDKFSDLIDWDTLSFNDSILNISHISLL